MKRRITVAALLVGLAIPAGAQAAPSMWIDAVASPSGPARTETGDRVEGHTTWHLGVSGTRSWDTTACTSTAWYGSHFFDGEYYTDHIEGTDQNPDGPADSWYFAASTPSNEYYDESYPAHHFLPLSHVTATCKLARKRYVGMRYWYERESFSKDASRTRYRYANGCRIYTYSSGTLTVDCRRSSTSATATWTFRTERFDRRISGTVYFDRSRSTMGPHRVRVMRLGLVRKLIWVQATVSPGTMITYTSADVELSRRYSQKAYRNESKTLTARWPG